MQSLKKKPVSLVLFSLCFALFASVSTASAEQSKPMKVGDWMELTSKHKVSLFKRTLKTARTESTVALAMFEAANAIEQSYPSQLGISPSSQDAHVTIAIASAARHVLIDLYPEKSEIFNTQFDQSLRSFARDKTFMHSVQIGVEAAQAALLQAQAVDTDLVRPFRTTTPVGEYIPEGTPSLITDFDLALKPWALKSAQSARPGPPPSISSNTYARDLAEVQKLGRKENSTRTDAQTETAYYWFLIDMNPILRQITQAPDRSTSMNARLYTMFYMAADDAWLSAGDAKTYYQFWRPITAIRSADRDRNSKTSLDSYWTPLMPTPPHPEYPCAHCVQASAQAEILLAEINDPSRTFLIKSSTKPNAQARSVTLAEYVEQVSLSRIYAGAHYRFSNDAGESSGKEVAKAVIEKWSSAHK